MQSKRNQILQSAVNTITRYGYRRTSMDDIAKEAGMSRPAIYQHFKNKEAVAIAAIEMVQDQGFETAKKAGDAFEDVTQKVAAYLAAYMLYYFRLIVVGPHADELLEIKKQFSANEHGKLRQELGENINDILGLPAAHETGHILAAAGEGIKMAALDEATLKKRINVLVQKFTS